MRRNGGLAVVSALLLGAVPAIAKGPETAEKTWTLSVPVPAGSALRVGNLLGSVRIRGPSEKGDATVSVRAVAAAKTLDEAAKLAGSVTVGVEREGAGTGIRVGLDADLASPIRLLEGDDGTLLRRLASLFDRKGEGLDVEYGGRTFRVVEDRKAPGLAVHLDVAVPFDTPVAVRQEIGSIRIEVARSDVRVEAMAGSVEVSRCFGSVLVDGGEASVRVASLQGSALEIATAGGPVELLDVRARRASVRTGAGPVVGTDSGPEDLAIETLSGPIALSGIDAIRVEIRTASGDVDFASYLRRTRRAVVRSESGDVVLRLGEVIGFDLAAATPAGEVRALGMEMAPAGRDGDVARYRRGAGGPDLEVTAAAGNLTVRPYGASRLDLLVRKPKP